MGGQWMDSDQLETGVWNCLTFTAVVENLTSHLHYKQHEIHVCVLILCIAFYCCAVLSEWCFLVYISFICVCILLLCIILTSSLFLCGLDIVQSVPV